MGHLSRWQERHHFILDGADSALLGKVGLGVWDTGRWVSVVSRGKASNTLGVTQILSLVRSDPSCLIAIQSTQMHTFSRHTGFVLMFTNRGRNPIGVCMWRNETKKMLLYYWQSKTETHVVRQIQNNKVVLSNHLNNPSYASLMLEIRGVVKTSCRICTEE